MKNLHLGHCLIGIAAAVVLLLAFGVSAGSLGFVAIALACPLMMLVMMRTMMGGHSAPPPPSEDEPTKSDQLR